MKAVYTLVIIIYTGLIHIVSLFNQKALLWVKGRRKWSVLLKEKINRNDNIIWIHCASLGEFEQGRPVIEMIKEKAPETKILLTFFSPSGFEIMKSWPLADYISYLPADTPANSERFIDIAKPSIAIFIKYEFWNNYLSALYKRDIPLYLVSGIFRPDQHFFKWYGRFFRTILRKFTHIFVQDSMSVDLLRGIGITNVSSTGDTRFDRVSQIAKAAKKIPQMEQFRGNEKLFIAGSSWKQDEEIIAQYINRFPGRMKWVIAPHEIDIHNIERLEKLFNVKHVRFSQFNKTTADARVLIIDNIGMLSSAYRYAYIAEVGGGFGDGIHNILEPACWGIPVMFGPKHKKFREAIDLINENGAMTFDSFGNFSDILDKWLTDEIFYLKSAKSASDYINKNTGATSKILQKILPKDINEFHS
jgi:3-deoxy-D-manno-octulosonic-acid transferase